MPTASGKTYGILRCWLAGLANAPEKTPRRLVYVVNRRAVIDQVYEDALQLADLLKGSELGELFHKHVPGSRKGEPLSVYAFRGQRALDDSWLIWPAQPSILVGTVDMIGSRLLFRSYVGAGNCHVVISTPEPIRGPLLLGKGRFFGLGLFAPVRALKFQSP